MTIGKILQYLGIVTILVALVIVYHFYITLGLNDGRSLLGSIIMLNSFFTITTNTFALLVLLAHLGLGGSAGSFLRRPVVVATALAAYLIVMIVYHALIADQHDPEGWDAFSNILRHYAGPVIFAVWWFLEARTGSLRWADLPWLTVYPLVYLAYVFVRGLATGDYPYPFLNLDENGVAGVAPTVAGIFIAFLLVGAIIIVLDRRNRRNDSPE